MPKFNNLVGIDGCSKGWILISGKSQNPMIDNVQFSASLSYLLSGFQKSIIVIDMPTVLTSGYHRECDILAKRFLGSKKQSTVFLTPSRTILECKNYTSANELSKKKYGKGLSKQAWNLKAKIIEVGSLKRSSNKIIEGHPECSFKMLKKEGLESSKKTSFGMFERLKLLKDEGLNPIEVGSKMNSNTDVKADDLIDAMILFWTARRVYERRAHCLPPEGPKNLKEEGRIFI